MVRTTKLLSDSRVDLSLTEDWRDIRDCLSGPRAVKRAETRYMPKPSGMLGHPHESQMYGAYLSRANFYDIPKRTRQMLIGMAMRREPQFEAPDALEATINGRTARGLSLNQLTSKVIGEQMTVGRVGILTDMPSGEPSTDNTPYWTMYLAEDILDWSEDYTDGRQRLVYVRLRESIDDQPKDAEPTTDDQWSDQERYRELYLDDNGRYRVRIVTVRVRRPKGGKPQVESETEEHEESDKPVLVRGAPMTFIPFEFVNVEDTLPEPRDATMSGLCQLMLSHYRNSADLEQLLYMTAQPQYWRTGVDPNDKDLPSVIGSSVIWDIPHHEARVGIAEFTGKGADALRQSMLDKEDRAAVLGAQMIRSAVNRNETSETARLRNRGETSALLSSVNTAEQAITKSMGNAALMVGADPNAVSVTLNRDFVETRMAGSELADFVKAHQDGGLGGGEIGRRNLVYNLRAGEVLDPKITNDEILASMPEKQGAGGEDA